MTKSSGYTILVVGCDKYMDAAKASYFLFKKHWSEALEKIIFVTDKQPSISGDFFTNVLVVDSPNYSDRILNAIKNIQTKYVLLLLDDYFITKHIDNDFVHNLIISMQNQDINYFKLIGLPRAFTKYKKIHNTYLIKPDAHYGISLQQSIWDVDFLKFTCETTSKTAWEYEVNMGKLQEHENFKGIQTNKNLLSIKNGILKGKLFPSTNKFLVKSGYTSINRPKISKFDAIKFHVQQQSLSYIPNNMRKIAKKIGRLFGKKYYSEN